MMYGHSCANVMLLVMLSRSDQGAGVVKTLEACRLRKFAAASGFSVASKASNTGTATPSFSLWVLCVPPGLPSMADGADATAAEAPRWAELHLLPGHHS